MNDPIRITGDLVISVYGPDGVEKERVEHKNLVVDAGKQWVAARLFATGIPNPMSHMAIGTGTASALAANTQLGTEVRRNALGSGSPTGMVANYSATFAAGEGTGAITEAGIFNNATAGSGTMLCRTTFPVVNKGALDSMTINWTVTVN